MYTSYFEFKKDPFNLKLDPDFFYQTSSWTSLYEWFSGQVLARKGVLMLMGTEGVGKTLLLFQIVSRLQNRAKFVYFHVASDSYEEFIDNLCDEVGLDVTGKLIIDKLLQLNDYLTRDKNIRTVIVVDDAHKLKDTVLHDILLTSTPPTKRRSSIQVILSGLPELEEKYNQLKSKSLALESDKAFLYNLKSLDSKGVSEYINQRLSVVGYTETGLFSKGALSKIAKHSKGVPLLVNTLCRLCLERASEQEVQTVSGELVDSVSSSYFAKQATAQPEQPKVSEILFIDRVARFFDGLTERFATVVEVFEGMFARIQMRHAAIGLAAAGVLLISFFLMRTNSPGNSVGADQMATNKFRDRSIPGVEIGDLDQVTSKASVPDMAVFESDSDGILGGAADDTQFFAALDEGDTARLFIDELEGAKSAVDLDSIYERAEFLNNEQKLKDAYLLYFYAARQGHANAAFRLGQFADPETFDPNRSMLISPNSNQAHKWYQSAVLAGHPKAKQSLGRLRSQVEKLAASGDERAYHLTLQWQ